RIRFGWEWVGRGLEGRSAPCGPGIRDPQTSAAEQRYRVALLAGRYLVAGGEAPRRRTVQDRQRRLDRLGQRKLLPSGHLGGERIDNGCDAAPDRLSLRAQRVSQRSA